MPGHSQHPDTAVASPGQRRLPTITMLSRLNHTPDPLAVYASQPALLPVSRKTRFRLVASSTGRD
jgi:hypothetical protein